MAGVEAAHNRFGKLPFRELFAPATYDAENGFRLHAIHDGMLRMRTDVLTRLPETNRIFTDENGELLRGGISSGSPSLPPR